jgi:hypothetical protein
MKKHDGGSHFSRHHEPPLMAPTSGGKHGGDGKPAGMDIGKHGHSAHSGGHGHIPHAGHGLHHDHPMLHHDGFHKNEHHG